jgi:hypothetical protein
LLRWIASLLGLDRSECYIAVARLSLWWERVWPALWPATGIVGLFAAAALFDLFAQIPTSLHLILLLADLGLSGIFPVPQFPRPCARRIGRKARVSVERDSAHSHIVPSPNVMTGSRRAHGDAIAEALWRVHMKRLLAAIYRLRLRLPSAGTACPRSLCLALCRAACSLVAWICDGGSRLEPQARGRIHAGFECARYPSALLDAWITPPAYTGVAPIYLVRTTVADKPIAVPAGSQLVMRVHEAPNRPSVTIDPTPDGRHAEFHRARSNEYGASVRLTADEVCERARRRAGAGPHWRIKTVPDLPPVIAFAEPPSKTERNALKIAFTAGDDYGVVSARALIYARARQRQKE